MPKPFSTKPPAQLVEPIWERQPGEPGKWYQAFLLYANMAPGKRSYAGAWRQWQTMNGRNPATDPTETWVERYQGWSWGERADAMDVAKAAEAKQNWLDLDMARRQQDYQMGQQLRDMALERLATVDDEGELRDKLSPMQAVKLAQVASKLQQAALSGLRPQQGQIRELLDNMPPQLRGQVVHLLMAKLQGKG